MSRDSDSWPEILISEMDSLYINQMWTMVGAPMGLTQQVAIRDAYLNFCFCHTPSRKVGSSGRANAFINSGSLLGVGTSIFDGTVKIFDFIKNR